MKFVIDRFEGEFAIVELENKEIIEIPRSIIPTEAREGDVLTISIDENETEDRKKRIKEKFENLFC